MQVRRARGILVCLVLDRSARGIRHGQLDCLHGVCDMVVAVDKITRRVSVGEESGRSGKDH